MEINIGLIVANLISTMILYAITPTAFSLIRKTPITKRKFRIICYIINFILMVIVKALLTGNMTNWAPYIIWSSVFISLGLSRLNKKELIIIPSESTESRPIADSNKEAPSSQIDISTEYSDITMANIETSRQDRILSDHAAIENKANADIEIPSLDLSVLSPSLRRAFIFIEDEEWDKADNYLEKVLDEEPENAYAYLGKALIEVKINSLDCIETAAIANLCKSKNYTRAYKYADNDLKNLLDSWRTINDNYDSSPAESSSVFHVNPTYNDKKPKQKKLNLLAASIAIICFLVITFWGFFIAAHQIADKGDFSLARKLTPIGSFIIDPRFEDYLDAGDLYEEHGYFQAQHRFQTLADSGYRNSLEFAKRSQYEHSIELLEKGDHYGITRYMGLLKERYPLAVQNEAVITDLMYEDGISAYHNSNYGTANLFFEAVPKYKRSQDYIALIAAHNGRYVYIEDSNDPLSLALFSASNENAPQKYNNLLKLIGFEDANSIIINNYFGLYLNGDWKTSDGKYYFSFDKESFRERDNLPASISSGTYSISDCIYTLNDGHSESKIFRFKVLDEDTLSIYCFKDGSIHTMYRQ